MKKLIAILPLVALTGCASLVLPSPKQLDSLARDTNSIKLRVQTIYGNMDLERNMDRFMQRTGPWATNFSDSFTVYPETTIKVEKNK